MKFAFMLEDSNIEITRSFWLGKNQVLVDGTEVKKQSEDNSYHIKLRRGKTRRMKILGSGLDGVPRVFIDGEKHQIARKLFWYEYLVSCMPLVIVLMGGALGGFIGVAATFFNLNIIRREFSYAVRLLLVLMVSLAAVAAYMGLTYLYFQLAK